MNFLTFNKDNHAIFWVNLMQIIVSGSIIILIPRCMSNFKTNQFLNSISSESGISNDLLINIISNCLRLIFTLYSLIILIQMITQIIYNNFFKKPTNYINLFDPIHFRPNVIARPVDVVPENPPPLIEESDDESDDEENEEDKEENEEDKEENEEDTETQTNINEFEIVDQPPPPPEDEDDPDYVPADVSSDEEMVEVPPPPSAYKLQQLKQKNN
jgi:hypothetical protein